MPTIASLNARDASRIERHLIRLDTDDRSLRFAAGLVTDQTIAQYVARIPFEQDALLGLLDDEGQVVGFAHGCLYAGHDCALHVEMAFSVDAPWRGQGFGALLMKRLEETAIGRGAGALIGVCIARNLPMRRIFERAGMHLTREEDEVHAFLAVPTGAASNATSQRTKGLCVQVGQ